MARLPVEILFQIIFSANTSLADLAGFSRVCRLWYQILFPLLYETVYLSWDAPAFAARILYEHVESRRPTVASTILDGRYQWAPIDGLRVTDHVRKLVLDNRIQQQHNTFHALESTIIVAALPKLTKLKTIEWTLPWLPDDAGFFSTLSRCCTQIEHVSFDIPINTDRYDDEQFDDMFSFTHLKHIRLKDLRLAHDPDTGGYIPPGLIQMILASPELEYLELELQEDPQNEEHEETGWLIEAIEPVLEHNFPNLRSFLLKGSANIDSEYLIQADQHSSIRDFLFRHPELRTLELPWDWSMNALVHEPLQLATPALRGILPRLRHFAGPTYLVMVFLQLELAQSLEHLGIHDTADDEESDLSKFTRSFPRLSNLRRLDFLSSYMLDCMSFSEVIQATPNIIELTLLWVDGDPEITRATLTNLPNLKYLNLGFNVLPHLANRRRKYVSKEQESHEVFELARQCACLTLLRIYPEEVVSDTFDYQMCWHIERYSTGVINTTFSCLRKRPDVGGDLMLDREYYRWVHKVFTEQYWGFTPTVEIK